jgi:hypothetical protein
LGPRRRRHLRREKFVVVVIVMAASALLGAAATMEYYASYRKARGSADGVGEVGLGSGGGGPFPTYGTPPRKEEGEVMSSSSLWLRPQPLPQEWMHYSHTSSSFSVRCHP